jgi:hypothetical protein
MREAMKEKLVDRVRAVIASGTPIDPDLFLDTAGASSTDTAYGAAGKVVADSPLRPTGMIAGVITIAALTFLACMFFNTRRATELERFAPGPDPRER